ncbi:MAG TPA: hypothetical protein VMV94_13790 [Phycisphaerae bacterium]|nr:hypothetical protein [Phycisphaerae bacterium]
MNRKDSLPMKWGLLLMVPFTCLPAGCGVLFAPPPEAVLAGTWNLTTQTTEPLTQLLLTFDQNGTLTTIVYQIGTDLAITTAVVSSSTDVNGKQVTISTTFLGGTLSFNGTLNDANNVITGTLTTEIVLAPLTTVTINGGAATLTKQ